MPDVGAVRPGKTLQYLNRYAYRYTQQIKGTFSSVIILDKSYAQQFSSKNFSSFSNFQFHFHRTLLFARIVCFSTFYCHLFIASSHQLPSTRLTERIKLSTRAHTRAKLLGTIASSRFPAKEQRILHSHLHPSAERSARVSSAAFIPSHKTRTQLIPPSTGFTKPPWKCFHRPARFRDWNTENLIHGISRGITTRGEGGKQPRASKRCGHDIVTSPAEATNGATVVEIPPAFPSLKSFFLLSLSEGVFALLHSAKIPKPPPQNGIMFPLSPCTPPSGRRCLWAKG